MRCINCGLPLSPARTVTHCPRCNTPLRADQGEFQQPLEVDGWGNMGGTMNMPQGNPWTQVGSTTPARPFPQGPQAGMGISGGLHTPGRSGAYGTPARQPQTPRRVGRNTRPLFVVAGLCVMIGALLLVTIFFLVLGATKSSPVATASVQPTTTGGGSTPQVVATASATATDPGVSPTASGTAYPAAQYIDSAQMATGVNAGTMQPTQVTTTFPVGSNMYVIFALHPPSQGGAVCSLWYLNGGSPITSYSFNVSAGSHASYTYAMYNSAGSAYVELYWASDKTCSDKVLAQRVDFTVTTS